MQLPEVLSRNIGDDFAVVVFSAQITTRQIHSIGDALAEYHAKREEPRKFAIQPSGCTIRIGPFPASRDGLEKKDFEAVVRHLFPSDVRVSQPTRGQSRARTSQKTRPASRVTA